MKKSATYILLILAAIFSVAAALPVSAQQNNTKIAAQRRIIADLEKKIADEERKISDLKNNKASTQERVRILTRQIQNRDDLLSANERQLRLLQREP